VIALLEHKCKISYKITVSLGWGEQFPLNQVGCACRYQNQTGVEIRPVDWGGLGGVESLDPSLPQFTPIYKSLTEGLRKAGYKEGVDLFGAPYDFRLAADGLEQAGADAPSMEDSCD